MYCTSATSCGKIIQHPQRSRALLNYNMCRKARSSPLNTWHDLASILGQMPHFSQGCQHKSRKCKVTWAKSQFPANVTWIPRSELPSSSEVQTKHIMTRSDSYSVFLTLGRAHAFKRKAPRTCDVLMTGRVHLQIAHLQLAIPVPSLWNFEEYETNLKWTQLLSWLLWCHMMSFHTSADWSPHDADASCLPYLAQDVQNGFQTCLNWLRPIYSAGSIASCE